jgi:cohesin domain-containing protein
MSFRSLARILAAIIPLIVSAAAQDGRAQQTAPSALPPPYLAIGTVEGSPGASVIVPVYYTADPKTAIRHISLDIEFVSNNLEFQDASKGVIDEDSLEITSTLTKGAADSKGVTRSKVRLTASLNGAKSDQGLSEGLIAYLMFQLSAEAKPFIITLTPANVSAEDTQKPARKVSSLRAQPGSISVLSADVTPEMSCFFFTH